MDHAWMTAGSIPLAVSATDETRITSALGFDPAAASVKAEVLQILQTQSAVAADPARRVGGGYRETPLEIVPIGPGLPPAAAVPAAAEPANHWPWWLGGLAAGAAVFVLVIRKLRERRP
jgi:hypothetical protein